MQFKVPQDVLRSDKIVGFLTLRQLIIVGIGGGMAYSLYIVLSKQYVVTIWLVPVVFLALVTMSFAFITFHDIVFEKLVLVFIEYKLRPRARTWQKMRGDAVLSVFDTPIQRGKQNTGPVVPQINEQDRRKKLEEISRVVDTPGSKLTSIK